MFPVRQISYKFAWEFSEGILDCVMQGSNNLSSDDLATEPSSFFLYFKIIPETYHCVN